MQMKQTGAGEWVTGDELWRRQKMMDWEDLVAGDSGWGDMEMSVDEMLAEVREGWRLLDTFGDDDADNVSA